jgi:MFS family permease
VMPTAVLIFAVCMVHAVSDGLTVSSTGVAVGMVTPDSRHASAQGLLGGFQTLTAGVIAVLAGWLYEFHGRLVAYVVCSILMAVLVVAALVLAGPEWRARRGPSVAAEPPDPVSAVTGHA